MSDSISASDVPEDIGRNDPCPCGSGRKYKKCCQRAHRLAREADKKSNEPHRIIEPETIPSKVFHRLQQIHENNAVALFYDLTHEQSPFRQRHTEKSQLVEAIDRGDQTLPAGPGFELVHLRLDPPDTHLLIREDDPKPDQIAFQILTLRPNELDADGAPRDAEHQGYRIWDYATHRLDRSEVDGLPPMESFGIQWHPA